MHHLFLNVSQTKYIPRIDKKAFCNSHTMKLITKMSPITAIMNEFKNALYWEKKITISDGIEEMTLQKAMLSS